MTAAHRAPVTATSDPARSSPVDVTFPDPGPRRRGVLAARPVVALPHLASLGLVSALAWVVAAVTWVPAALGRARPAGVAAALGDVVRWRAAVLAYAVALTDDRPPLWPTTGGQPAVEVRFHTGTLGRWPVLARPLLAVPAALVLLLIGIGVAIATPFAWATVVASGRAPRPLADALAAVVRFDTRFYGYAWLLTSEYPRWLFGDPVPHGATPSSPWQLALGEGAKWVVAVLLITGSSAFAAGMVALSAARHPAPTLSVRAQVAQAYGALTQEIQRATSTATGCRQASDPVGCLEANDREASTAFANFATTLGSIDLPRRSLAPARRVGATSAAAATVFDHLARAGDRQAYNRALQAAPLQTLLVQLNTRYDQLVASLGAGG